MNKRLNILIDNASAMIETDSNETANQEANQMSDVKKTDKEPQFSFDLDKMNAEDFAKLAEAVSAKKQELAVKKMADFVSTVSGLVKDLSGAEVLAAIQDQFELDELKAVIEAKAGEVGKSVAQVFGITVAQPKVSKPATPKEADPEFDAFRARHATKYFRNPKSGKIYPIDNIPGRAQAYMKENIAGIEKGIIGDWVEKAEYDKQVADDKAAKAAK